MQYILDGGARGPMRALGSTAPLIHLLTLPLYRHNVLTPLPFFLHFLQRAAMLALQALY